MDSSSFTTLDKALNGTSSVPGRTTLDSAQTTSIQLALDIFNSLSPLDEGIEKSPEEIGFRKNNIFLEITGLGLAARRAIDTAYFIVAQSGDENELYSSDAYRYSVDKHFFKWLMGTSSRNWRHLRTILREAQQGAIEVTEELADVADGSRIPLLERLAQNKEDGPENNSNQDIDNSNWISVQLIGAVAITQGRVNFEVNPTLAKHIKNPRRSHFLSLRYVFRSLYAKSLYDLVVPFSSSGITPWIKLEDFKRILDCNTTTYEQFKYLRQFILNPALAEVNSITNLKLELQTHNLPKTRRIGYVRFVIEASENNTSDPHIELKDLFLTLRNEFGINNSQMNRITVNREEWTVERIKDAIEYTRYNIQKGKVRNSSAYLMKAIEEGYKLGSAQLEIDAIQDAKNSPANIPEDQGVTTIPSFSVEQRKADIEAGWKLFESLDPSAQARISRKFCKTPQAKIAAARDKVKEEDIAASLSLPGLLNEEFGLFVHSKNQA